MNPVISYTFKQTDCCLMYDCGSCVRKVKIIVDPGYSGDPCESAVQPERSCGT